MQRWRIMYYACAMLTFARGYTMSIGNLTWPIDGTPGFRQAEPHKGYTENVYLNSHTGCSQDFNAPGRRRSRATGSRVRTYRHPANAPKHTWPLVWDSFFNGAGPKPNMLITTILIAVMTCTLYSIIYVILDPECCGERCFFPRKHFLVVKHIYSESFSRQLFGP